MDTSPGTPARPEVAPELAPDLVRAAMISLDLSEPLAKAALKRGVKDMGAWRHAAKLQERANEQQNCCDVGGARTFATGNRTGPRPGSQPSSQARRATGCGRRIRSTHPAAEDLERYVRVMAERERIAAEMKARAEIEGEIKNGGEP